LYHTALLYFIYSFKDASIRYIGLEVGYLLFLLQQRECLLNIQIKKITQGIPINTKLKVKTFICIEKGKVKARVSIRIKFIGANNFLFIKLEFLFFVLKIIL
jgi:hypothetical protein